MRGMFETMGTVASIALPDDHPETVDGIRQIFTDAEQRFSLYRLDSELSLVNTGELSLTSASAELRDAYALAMNWHLRTAGAFTPNRPDGAIDLNGIVKALCISHAGDLLLRAGHTDWSIGVGGDILCAGQSPTGDWITGIVDPRDRQALLCSLPLGDGRRAIATSGSAERGDHIWTFDREAAPEFTQVTVVAEDIIIADALATAIMSGGREMLDLATDTWAIDALAVLTDGSLLATPGVRSRIAA
jgi:thiamine biosynthesis lipoprotein